MKLRKPEYWRQKEAGAEKGASFRLGYQHGRKEVLEEVREKVENYFISEFESFANTPLDERPGFLRFYTNIRDGVLNTIKGMK